MFEVKQFFDNQIIPCLKEGSTIDMYTYCKVNGNMIRGDPLFQDKIHWHDWFYAINLTFTKVRGKIDKHVPVQVISFLHIVGIEKPITGYPNSKQKFSIKKDGFYALVHYVPLPLSYTYFEGKDKNHLAHQDSLLMYYSRKTLVSFNIRMQRDLILINMNNFHSTCIAINDVQPAPYKKNAYIFLKSKSEWINILRKHMISTITYKKKTKELDEKIYGNNETTIDNNDSDLDMDDDDI